MSTRSWAFFALSALSLLGIAAAASAATEELPKLGVTLPATSVSGLSSGAYMAGQIEVAHSKDIVGAGIVAGGPFACAETASSRAFSLLAHRAVAERHASRQCLHEGRLGSA